jgi:RNA-directed DNA polymerase
MTSKKSAKKTSKKAAKKVAKKVAKKTAAKRVSLLKLSHVDAMAFFLKGESYYNFDLPPYFEFDSILAKVSELIDGKDLKTFCKPNTGPRDFDDLNHTLFHNKDGKFAWRPLEFSHPALYVSLVHSITEAAAWTAVCQRFKLFAKNKKIVCVSMPVQSATEKSDKAEQILHWWEDLEQRSIELSIEYEHMAHTDITDCYSSIYTHSIVWALHGMSEAKKKGNRNNPAFIGNVIDGKLQDMNYGQTNGIPQGSVLMDFIAEIVLGYADTLITEEIKTAKIRDYHILRYRDDYRIFVNNPAQGSEIVKIISQVLIGLGLKLSSSKTKFTNSVIKGSVKDDKIDWIKGKAFDSNLQKHLLLIHDFSISHPNSGSLIRALSDFHRRITKVKGQLDNAVQIAAILVDISVQNPRSYPLVAGILSKLLTLLREPKQKTKLFDKIRKRLDRVPNTGHLQIWLQRVSRSFDESAAYEEPLCRLVSGEDVQIWNSTWINPKCQLKTALQPKKILNKKALNEVIPVIPPKEVELFDPYSD